MLQYPYGRRPVRRVPVRRTGFSERYNPFEENRTIDPTHIAPDQPTVQAEPLIPDGSIKHRQRPAPVENHQPEPTMSQVSTPVTDSKPETDWQNIATQLQADMDNFRKRQRRQAEEASDKERERLLRLFLPVVDNLSRALNHNGTEDDNLRQGVELTHRELMRVLGSEGVTQIETVGQPFDPSYHEALAIISSDAAPDTIVQEVEAGYTLNDKLLRPAKVIVSA